MSSAKHGVISSEYLKGYGFNLLYMWHIVYPMNVVSFDILAVFAVPLVLGRVSLVAAIFLLFYQLHSFLSCFVPSLLPPLLSSFIHLVLRHDLGFFKSLQYSCSHTVVVKQRVQ